MNAGLRSRVKRHHYAKLWLISLERAYLHEIKENLGSGSEPTKPAPLEFALAGPRPISLNPHL